MKRLALSLIAALLGAGGAHAATPYLSLPSPVAPLSVSPPIGAGAAASAEGIPHRIHASTTVRVSIDSAGSPFAVAATQALDVRRTGDYFFTIGAPVLDVRAAAGSASAPGLRSSSIVWAGFNPGRRLLKARAVLDAAAVSSSLPLRVDVEGTSTVLVNTTGVSVSVPSADADRRSVIRYLTELRGALRLGQIPATVAVPVTAPPRSMRVRVVVPLSVTGRIGSRAVSAVVDGSLTVPARGRVDLRVAPTYPRALIDGPVAGLSGRALFDRATRATLTVARVRQYRTFLGNPDPAGTNSTVYEYVTATRPVARRAAPPARDSRDWLRSAAVAAALVTAFGAGLVVWARS